MKVQTVRQRQDRPRGVLWRLLVASSAIVAVALSGCVSYSPVGEAPASSRTIRVQDIPSRILVAHRGSPLKFPEESMEAFRSTADSGYPLEMDIKSLGDGTLVPSHDWSVDRTMIGASGKLDNLSKDQWLRMEIRGVGEGDVGTPTTWDELLDIFGGKILMVPQIDVSPDRLDGFMESIIERGIIDSIIVQSWNLETTAAISAAGLHALHLVTEKKMMEPEAIAAAGIEFVGAPTSVSADYIQELNSLGISVWIYTVNTPREAEVQYAKGAVGIFTDDPWFLSSAHKE